MISSQAIDRIFTQTTQCVTGCLLILMLGMLGLLLIFSWPVMTHGGFASLLSDVWDPVSNQYGIIAPLSGTLITATLALILAVPISFGVAVFTAYMAPLWLKKPLVMLVQLMAGIPSIIYGMWGLFVLVPIMANAIQPMLGAILNMVIPGWTHGPFIGISLLSAGVVLAIMVIPFIAAMLYHLITHIPKSVVESAYSAGANRREVIWHVLLPMLCQGALGSIILGFGRALGETMAVTFVIGNVHHFSLDILSPGSSIASTIANEFAEATGELYPAALLNLGLILFVITFIVIICSRLLMGRLRLS